MKIWAVKDCVAAGAQLKQGKEYDLPEKIANKLISGGYASEKMPVKKVENKAE